MTGTIIDTMDAIVERKIKICSRNIAFSFSFHPPVIYRSICSLLTLLLSPKGPMSCRTQGGISRRPSIRLSILPSIPPIDHQGLKLALPGLNLALEAKNQPSWLQISPPMPQNCPADLKSALQTFNQPFKHKTSPQNLKSALQA